MNEPAPEIALEINRGVGQVKIPEIVSDEKYVRYVHTCGHETEVARKIMEEGLACDHGDLESTAMQLPAKVDQAKLKLESSHKGRTVSVVIGLPRQVVAELENLKRQNTIDKQIPTGHFFLTPDKTVEVPVGDQSAIVQSEVIDSCFIEGYYSVEDGRFIPNPRFVKADQDKFAAGVIQIRIAEEKAKMNGPIEEWWQDPDYQKAVDESIRIP